MLRLQRQGTGVFGFGTWRGVASNHIEVLELRVEGGCNNTNGDLMARIQPGNTTQSAIVYTSEMGIFLSCR